MMIDPTELRERLEKALVVLEDDRRRTAFPATAKRLGGKIEGVKLALGYLDDAERMTPLESLAETALALLGVEATPENMAKALNIRVIALAPDVAAALSTEPTMLVDEGYALAHNATPVDLDALARQARKPEVDRLGVHAAHCCSKHGCKYGQYPSESCPVVNGRVPQEFPCERCDEEAEEARQAPGSLNPYANPEAEARYDDAHYDGREG